MTKGAKVLVIGAIDGTTLSDILQKAADAGVKVIAYDRLIRDSAMSTITPPSTLPGPACCRRPRSRRPETPTVPPTEEHRTFPAARRTTTTPSSSTTARCPFCSSDRQRQDRRQVRPDGMDQVGTLRWDGRGPGPMENLLSSAYTDAKVDGVLSPYDGLSIGIISALKGVGYGSGDMPMPIVTGQDAELPSVKSILAGEQYSTVFKDTRELAKVTVNMVNAIMDGKEPEVNDTKTYENGVKVVPSYLLKPVSVDKSNAKEVLVGSGYYTEDQLNN